MHTISGSIAKLDMSLRTCCDDLTSVDASLRRLREEVQSLPPGSPSRADAEASLYQAELVMKGAGPAGALDGYLKPPKNGAFMRLFLGAAVDVTSQRQENRLKVKEEYYSFRDRSTVTYTLWPLFLLYLNAQRSRKVLDGEPFVGITLVTVFPVLAVLLVLDALLHAVGARENVLRAKQRIRKWWINHHYYSIGMRLVVLTMDVQSHACLNYMSRFLVFTALQGAVMLAQNRPAVPHATRVAMGKASRWTSRGAR